MSSDRVNSRPLKPVLASNRTARTPIAPRIAVKTTSNASLPATAPRVSARSLAVPSKVNDSNPRDSPGSGNITPRSAARKSRVESTQNSPSQDDNPSGTWPRTSAAHSLSGAERGSTAGPAGPALSRPRIGKSLSVIGDNTSRVGHSLLMRTSGPGGDSGAGAADLDSRFFHASDVQKQEPVPKRPEPKKAPTFFYADGKEDVTPPSIPLARSPSPVNSTVSEKRSSAPWMRQDSTPNPPKPTPLLSPTLSSIAASSPFFTPVTTGHLQVRSPSPSKENIHLSYRKGASQIFGTRPLSRPITSPVIEQEDQGIETRSMRPSLSPRHQKSTSLSSIDSGTSHQSRRRSATAGDPISLAPADLLETRPPIPPIPPTPSIPSRVTSPPITLPSIDTSLASPPGGPLSPPDGAMSPTKFGASELAADARRERKVLDLEISNSSLMAINTSLEREVRRQRAEIKRYRRLSRAGHFSLASSEHSGRLSDGLDTLDEDDNEGMEAFGLPSGLRDLHDEFSDSEDEEGSVLSGGESGIADMQSGKHQERLAKDERRLRMDLQRHKELLTQSQSMNQSLKRCMYATEDMIRDGKRALEYQVRVSDVKLGGRILTGDHDEDDYEGEQIEVEDDTLDGSDLNMESARRLLDVWSGLGRPLFEGSEISGDRDSGVELEKPFASAPAATQSVTSRAEDDFGRPPEHKDLDSQTITSPVTLEGLGKGVDFAQPEVLASAHR